MLGVSWQTIAIGVFAAVYMYSSGMGPSDGGSGGSSFGALEGNEWAYGQANIDAAKEGKVLDVQRHAQFLGALAHHRDVTGLPIITDFYSPSCVARDHCGAGGSPCQ